MTVSRSGPLPVRSRRGALLAALLILVVGWLASPGHLPVYDGVSAPDEPYRWVSPPAGSPAAKGPPTSASVTGAVKASTNAADLIATTKESGPQLALYLPAGAITPLSGSTVTVTATPSAPDGSAADGAYVGNAYAIAVAGGTTPHLTDAGSSSASVQLRAPTARQPGPTIEWRPTPTSAWERLATSRTGNDIYTSRFAGFGSYVLVQATQTSTTSGGGGGGGISGGLLVVLVLVGVLLLVIVGIRFARTRPRS